MIINKIEIKPGDYLVACASDYIGYHYCMSIAAKIISEEDNLLTLEGYYYYADDGCMNYKHKTCSYTKEAFLWELTGYVVGLYGEDAFNEMIEAYKTHEYNEDTIFSFAEAYFLKAKILFNSYEHLSLVETPKSKKW